MIRIELLRKYYPADRPDTTALFYTWVRNHVSADSVVLNLGAGPPTRQPVRVLRGEVRRLMGADIDPIVLENDELDEAAVIENGQLPFGDRTFDTVVSDFVLEHVTDPVQFLTEVHRVLKPGRPFLFRTPNIFHYVTTISRFTPHWFHRLVANRARGLAKEAAEPWETHYRMNSRRRLSSLAQAAGFRQVELRVEEAQPSYMLFHPLPFFVGLMWERTVNRSDRLEGLRVHIFGRFRR